MRTFAFELSLGDAGMGREDRGDLLISPGVGCSQRQIGMSDLGSFISQFSCDFMPSAEGLDMRGIALTHWPVHPEPRTILV